MNRGPVPCQMMSGSGVSSSSSRPSGRWRVSAGEAIEEAASNPSAKISRASAMAESGITARRKPRIQE